MGASLRKVQVINAVAMVAEQIREQIVLGEIKPGELLPAERNLAETFGVNRHTLRSALAGLQTEGLLSIRQGEGARVQDYRASSGLEIVRYLPRTMQDSLVRGFLEMRRAFALEAMTLACQRATAEKLDLLEELAQLQIEEQDQEQFILRDVEFARQVLRAADNLPLEFLLNSIVGFFDARPDIPKTMFADIDSVRMTYMMAVHILRAGDVEEIQGSVRKALEFLDQQTLQRFSQQKQSEELIGE